MKNITYAVNRDGFYARCGDRMAFFELDYKNMNQINNFEEKYTISDCSVFEFCEQNLRWTKRYHYISKTHSENILVCQS